MTIQKTYLILILMGLGSPAGLHAGNGDTFSYEGLDYNILSEDDLTCEVGTNANKIQGALIIPTKVICNNKEYTVTAIGDQAFYLDTSVSSITIPETVTYIGKEAFSRIFHIRELVIPNSVTAIGERVAYACANLEHVTLSSSCREIPHEAFSGLPLKGLEIPEGVEIINNESFNYCSKATGLTISSTVRYIGKMAFAGWNSLPEVTIPAGVQELGEEAFSYCYKLATVTLEESDTPIKLGINVFGQGLYAGTYDDPVAKITTLNLYRQWSCQSTEINEMPFAKKLWLKTINIGPRVTNLPANTFYNTTYTISAVNVDAEICPAAQANTFPNYAYSSAVLSVPENTLETFKAHGVWGKFQKIQGVKEPETGINSINHDGTDIVGYYNLNGCRVNGTPASGVYIVRMTDGTTQKVYIK